MTLKKGDTENVPILEKMYPPFLHFSLSYLKVWEEEKSEEKEDEVLEYWDAPTELQVLRTSTALWWGIKAFRENDFSKFIRIHYHRNMHILIR